MLHLPRCKRLSDEPTRMREGQTDALLVMRSSHVSIRCMIGFFDSGSGGLSVLAALRRHAPLADAVYFGDTAHAPYGLRDQSELAVLADKGMQTLRAFGAQEIIAACNTVSPHFLDGAAYGARVIEMTRPARKALEPHRGKRVLVLSTPATAISGIYERALDGLVAVDMLPIPALAGAIELDESEISVRSIVRRALMPLRGKQYDIVLLGCTHFPFVQDMIEEETQALFGPLHVMDPADAVAREAVARFTTYGTGSTYLYLSRDSDIFRKRVQSLFPMKSHVRVL